MTEKKQKNRRYRGAKFSEYRLKRIVECFAFSMSVKDAAVATRFSENTISDIYMRIRRVLYERGFMRVQRKLDAPIEVPAKAVFNKKYRGTPEALHLLMESEFLHRVYFTRRGLGTEKLSASSPDDVARAKKLARSEIAKNRYILFEMRPSTSAPDGVVQIPFDPAEFDKRSTILVNEVRHDPAAAFFDFIWTLLLKHPL